MSVLPTGGITTSAAGAPLSQARGDAERNAVDGAGRDRQTDSAQRAERNAGVGQTEDGQATSERDADGRRQWEAPTSPGESGEENETNQSTTAGGAKEKPPAKDPTGDAGTQLDLMG